MQALVICTVVFAMISSMGYSSIARAQNDYPVNTDRMRNEQERAIKDWIDAGKEHLESFKSPLINAEKIPRTLPAACIQHLKKDKEKLEKSGYSKEAWFHHIFECDKCCAPLLLDLMVMHVQRVTEQPHMVVLFDFDNSDVKDTFKSSINDLVGKNYDKDHDKILLIGRASKVGDRAYNIVLSGKRAGEVKDYFIEKFGVDESRIRFLYFGYDPPQLTPDYAKAYGITKEQLASIDAALSFKNSDVNKINQSVVIIFYNAQHDGHVAEKKS